MKKSIKYISITLLLLLGLFCVGILYLFFVPNSSLFNITYVNNHHKIISQSYQKDDIVGVCVNSRAYDVSILPSNNDEYYVEMYSNTFGFALTKNETVSIQSSLENNILTFNIKEAYGFAFPNSSYVKLYIPSETSPNISLTNLKAKTTINSPRIKINNLTYATTNGDFKFKQGEVLGDLNLTLNKSTFSISEAVKTKNDNNNEEYNNLTLSITTGKFDASQEVLGNVKVTNSSRGVINIKECLDYVQNTESAGGQINLSKVGSAHINSGDTIVTIGETTEGLTINLFNSGRISIGKLNAVSTLTTREGNINISNCLSSVTAHSDTGNINISNAMQIISVRTNYGNINVDFSESANKYDPSAEIKSRVLYASIYNGTLSASGVEHIGDSARGVDNYIPGITITGNGRINLLMNDVVGENKITGKNGNINVEINELAVYDLTTKTTAGTVRVNLLQISQFGGYKTTSETTTQVNHSGDSSANSLIIESNQGDLTVLDSIIASNGF